MFKEYDTKVKEYETHHNNESGNTKSLKDNQGLKPVGAISNEKK